MSGGAAIFGAIEQSMVDVLANLLETTDQINAQDSRYLTPLMVAILSAYSDLSKPTIVFDIVLSHVERVDARPYHDTALNVAMRRLVPDRSDINNVRLHIVTALLEKGANPHYPNGEGYSPFQIAVQERGEILFAFLSNWKSEYPLSLIPQIDDRLLTDFVTNMQMCENGTISFDTAIATRIANCELIDMRPGKSSDLMLKWFTENFSYPHPIPRGVVCVFLNKLSMLIAGSGVKVFESSEFTFLPDDTHRSYHVKFVVRLPSSRVVGCILSPYVRFMRFVKVIRTQ